MKYLYLAIGLFLSMSIYGQDSVKIIKKIHDVSRDTLLVNGKIYLLESSFIQSFEGNRELFKKNEVWMLNNTRGYLVTWIVKKGILYLDHLRVDRGDRNTKVSLVEIQHRLELLTGRKFNSEGLLKADWVTGQAKADANGHYVRYIDSASYKSDDHYVFTFDEGKLQSFVKL